MQLSSRNGSNCCRRCYCRSLKNWPTTPPTAKFTQLHISPLFVARRFRSFAQSSQPACLFDHNSANFALTTIESSSLLTEESNSTSTQRGVEERQLGRERRCGWRVGRLPFPLHSAKLLISRSLALLLGNQQGSWLKEQTEMEGEIRGNSIFNPPHNAFPHLWMLQLTYSRTTGALSTCLCPGEPNHNNYE